MFHPLRRDQIRGIANIQLASLRDRLSERDLSIELSDAVLDHLAEAGFDPVYGARPLKRAIQQLVENPFAHAILAGEFGPCDTINAELLEGVINFTRVIGSARHHCPLAREFEESLKV